MITETVMHVHLPRKWNHQVSQMLSGQKKKICVMNIFSQSMIRKQYY